MTTGTTRCQAQGVTLTGAELRRVLSTVTESAVVLVAPPAGATMDGVAVAGFLLVVDVLKPDGDGISGFTLITTTESAARAGTEEDATPLAPKTAANLLAELNGQEEGVHVLVDLFCAMPHDMSTERGLLDWANLEHAILAPERVVLQAVDTFDTRQF